MSEKERKIRDAFQAEEVARRFLETHYGDNIKELSFLKSWYSREFWDVEGTLVLKKGKVKKKSFRYQIDPDSGEAFGYQEIPMR